MAAMLKISGICLLSIIMFILSSPASAEEQAHDTEDFTSIVKIFPYNTSTIQLAPYVKYVKEGDEKFNVCCFTNVPKSVFQIWRSVQLEFLNIPDDYKIYHGANRTEVHENYKSQSAWHPSAIFSGSNSIVEFPAFSPYCIGIATTEKYSFQFKIRTINYWKVLQTLLGSFLFIAAPSLSKNYYFHYAAGISVGVLASFLIILYFLSRFIPQKSASYAVLVFGYSFILYFLKLMYHHFHDVMTQYMDIVFGYLVTAALLSFVICYRIGPVTNERTLNIIQWSMQALSLVLIFFSSEYREVSTAIILLLLSIKIIPIRWFKWIKYLWYRCFPPRVKLLTEIEYIEQGHVETRKALEDLRKFCSSPDCKVWRVVRNLKDPIRFADFIETGNQYTDEELLEYNSEDFELSDTMERVNRNTYID